MWCSACQNLAVTLLDLVYNLYSIRQNKCEQSWSNSSCHIHCWTHYIYDNSVKLLTINWLSSLALKPLPVDSVQNEKINNRISFSLTGLNYSNDWTCRNQQFFKIFKVHRFWESFWITAKIFDRRKIRPKMATLMKSETQ